MTDPSEEVLRHLHGANIQHIAQMKEASRSVLRWTIGLTVSYVGLSVSGVKVPERLLALAGLFIICVAAFSVTFVLYTQYKMMQTRSQLHRLQLDLHLHRYTEDTPWYTSYRYGWEIWVPTAFLCSICGLVALWFGWPYFSHLWN